MKKILLISGFTILIIALSASLIWGIGVNKQKENYKNYLNSAYQKSFYDLVDNMNNLEVKLSKLIVSNDNNYNDELLSEIWRQSDNASDNLGQLPIGNAALQKTGRYLNQLGAYCKYLRDKGEISAEEVKQLENLYNLSVTLNKELGSAVANASSLDFSSALLSEDTNTNALSDSFKNFSEVSVDYPQLIYDGPFSESIESNKTALLTGPTVNEQTAISNLKAFLPSITLSDIKVQNTSQGDIALYYISATGSDSSQITAAVTQKGGNILWLSRYVANYNEPKLSDDDCAKQALQFAKDRGFTDLKAVFVQQINSSAIVNLAPVQDGVTLYSDLIKIKLNRVDGKIELWEAQSYILNHTPRTLEKSAITEAQAKAKLSGKLTLDSSGGLALIPVLSQEILCYEFKCTYNGSDYYIYIDAKTGQTVNIYRVVDTAVAKSVM